MNDRAPAHKRQTRKPARADDVRGHRDWLLEFVEEIRGAIREAATSAAPEADREILIKTGQRLADAAKIMIDVFDDRNALIAWGLSLKNLPPKDRARLTALRRERAYGYIGAAELLIATLEVGTNVMHSPFLKKRIGRELAPRGAKALTDSTAARKAALWKFVEPYRHLKWAYRFVKKIEAPFADYQELHFSKDTPWKGPYLVRKVNEVLAEHRNCASS